MKKEQVINIEQEIAEHLEKEYGIDRAISLDITRDVIDMFDFKLDELDQ